MKPYVGFAIASFLIGALFLAIGWGDQSNVLWTGRAVHAQERDGVVYYVVNGETYTVDDPGSHRNGSTTVYLNPDTPSNAVLDSTVDRLLDVVTIGVPFATAPVLIVVGSLRQRRRRRRRAGESSGHGLDSDVVRQLRERRDRGA